MIDAMPGTAPVVVNSAGCGAAMKAYGHLLGNDRGGRLLGSGLRTSTNGWPTTWPTSRPPSGPRQPSSSRTRATSATCSGRTSRCARCSRHVTEVVELDDEGLCCGAGGAYSALEPTLAGEIRDRKLAAIRRASQRSGATVVASANPGCAMHLQAAGVTVRHPVDIVAEAVRR